jgi:hypothetical protein
MLWELGLAVASKFSKSPNCSPSSFSPAVALAAFRTRVTAPHLRMGVSAEMARGRLGKTRGVEGVEESGWAFISYSTAFFMGLIFRHL